MGQKIVFNDWWHGRQRIRELHRRIYEDITKNAVCQICGKKNKNGERLEIHHFWLKESDEYTGIAFVCKSCHSKYFHHRKQRY